MAADQPTGGAGSGDRQVSPDQLDRLLTLIRPSLWVVLGALLVLVGITVVWGFVGTVRQTVQAQGLIQRGDGLQTIQAATGGRIVTLDAQDGDVVHSGDVLARIEADDGTRTAVTAAADGTVTDAAPDSGTIVAAGDRLFTIDPSGGKLHANVAVPVDRRSELFEGEQVQVRLGGVGDSELGYVHGEVEQVDPYPAGDDELRRVFGGQRLVDELAGDTAVYLVRVRLLEDPSTKSGLDWSSRTGASASVSAGELVDADFIVSESSLVEQVFP